MPFVLAPTAIANLGYFAADMPGRKLSDMMAHAVFGCRPIDRQPQWEPRLQPGAGNQAQ